MKVHLISFNESFLLPQVDAWWRSRFPNVSFLLFDNYSTDNTVELAVAHGWDVVQFKTDGLSDLVHIAIKNDLWKGCQDEWVWVSDFDELPGFTQDDLDALDSQVSAVRLNGYEFIDTAYTIEEACYAVPSEGFSKTCLFRPARVEEMNYFEGAHTCNPVLKEGVYAEKILDLYHMKWFSPTHALARIELIKGRLSAINKDRFWGIHYCLPLEHHLEYYSQQFEKRIKVR